jgi:RNA polymerase sigma factor (TIGR02999 family)
MHDDRRVETRGRGDKMRYIMDPARAPAMGIAASAVTTLLLEWRRGDATALDRLMPIVHGELRRLARRQLRREQPGHTLETGALVNEAYVRLVDLDRVQWQDRAHFFAMAARTMRRILVDHARARRSSKRGGGVTRIPLEPGIDRAAEAGTDVVALDDALTALSSRDPRKARVVELRFFGGLTVEETAAALHVSPETVMRDWRLAKAWLLRQMESR